MSQMDSNRPPVEKVNLLIPTRWSFGFFKQPVSYNRTPEVTQRAQEYVENVIKYQDGFHLSGDGYRKSFHWKRGELREEVTNANPQLMKDRHALSYVLDNECLNAAQGLQKEAEFLWANATIKRRAPYHPLPRRATVRSSLSLRQ